MPLSVSTFNDSCNFARFSCRFLFLVHIYIAKMVNFTCSMFYSVLIIFICLHLPWLILWQIYMSWSWKPWDIGKFVNNCSVNQWCSFCVHHLVTLQLWAEENVLRMVISTVSFWLFSAGLLLPFIMFVALSSPDAHFGNALQVIRLIQPYIFTQSLEHLYSNDIFSWLLAWVGLVISGGESFHFLFATFQNILPSPDGETNF